MKMPLLWRARLAKEEGYSRGHQFGGECLGCHPGGQTSGERGKLIVTVACSTGERYLSTPLAEAARAEVGG